LYNLVASVTYNQNIAGYTAITFYITTQPFPNNAKPIQTGTVIASSITAGFPAVLANKVVDGGTPGTYYLFVNDNRGNYSAPITITYPYCPPSPPALG